MSIFEKASFVILEIASIIFRGKFTQDVNKNENN